MFTYFAIDRHVIFAQEGTHCERGYHGKYKSNGDISPREAGKVIHEGVWNGGLYKERYSK